MTPKSKKTILVAAIVLAVLVALGYGLYRLAGQDYQGQVAEQLEQGWSLWLYVPVFLVGVLTSFTPCVYPVIPITVGYIGARAQGHRLHGFVLSLFYVVGLALVYAALGMIVGATKAQFGALQNNAWVLLAVANIMILMGASMVGAFEIPVPRFLQSSKTGAVKGVGGVLGALLVGMVAGLVVGPCTAPVLAVMLSMVASLIETNSTVVATVKGGSLMFVFALGMGVLLLIIGTFAGLMKSLPRPGGWMVTVKRLMGVLMFVLAAFFLVHLAQNASASPGEGAFSAWRHLPYILGSLRIESLKDTWGLMVLILWPAAPLYFVFDLLLVRGKSAPEATQRKRIMRTATAVCLVLLIELAVLALGQAATDTALTAELLNFGEGAPTSQAPPVDDTVPTPLDF